MRDPLGILELRSAVAGATAEVVRQVLDQRLPEIAPPSTAVEFDAWTWALYDLGLAAETLPDPARALEFYARSIGYNRTSGLLRSAALVRSGLCLEHLGRWGEAISAYRDAGEGSSGWPESRALMLWRLGSLLRAAEVFDEACSVLGQLLAMLPQPGIPEREAALEYAVCLEHSDRTGEALNILSRLASADHPVAVNAMLRLASLQLRLGRAREACIVLRRITDHPAAEAGTRAAASIRISQLCED